MAEKELSVLTDPAVEPTEKFLQGVLGEKYGWWMEIRDHVKGKHPAATEVWKYYNDGKQWLFRMMHGKNTLFWLSVLPGTFRITFYFPIKAELLVAGSALPEKTRTEFLTARLYGRIRPISLRMEDPSDLETFRQLVELKISIK